MNYENDMSVQKCFENDQNKLARLNASPVYRHSIVSLSIDVGVVV